MQSKSHFLIHFIPGILLGAVVGMAFGSLLVVSQYRTSTVKGPAPTTDTACIGAFKNLEVKEVNGHVFDIYLKHQNIYRVELEGGVNSLYNPGEFYQVSPDSDFAYLDFNPDGLGGYILYGGAMSTIVRVNTCTGKADMLFNSTLGQGTGRTGTDISFDDQYLVGIYYDLGHPGVFVRDIQQMGKAEGYPVPDDTFTQFDAKFSPDGSKIAVVGALGNPEDERGILWTFDMKTRKFLDGAEMTSPECGGSWILKGWKDDGTVDVEPSVVCGTSVKFNLDTENMDVLIDGDLYASVAMPDGGSLNQMVVSPDGKKIAVITGKIPEGVEGDPTTALERVWIFDVQTKTFAKYAAFPGPFEVTVNPGDVYLTINGWLSNSTIDLQLKAEDCSKYSSVPLPCTQY